MNAGIWLHVGTTQSALAAKTTLGPTRVQPKCVLLVILAYQVAYWTGSFGTNIRYPDICRLYRTRNDLMWTNLRTEMTMGSEVSWCDLLLPYLGLGLEEKGAFSLFWQNSQLPSVSSVCLKPTGQQVHRTQQQNVSFLIAFQTDPWFLEVTYRPGRHRNQMTAFAVCFCRNSHRGQAWQMLLCLWHRVLIVSQNAGCCLKISRLAE